MLTAALKRIRLLARSRTAGRVSTQAPSVPDTAGATAHETFQQDGYAILHRFYSDSEMGKIVDQILAYTRQRPLDVVIDLLDTGERSILGLLSEAEIAARRMKINDLYLNLPAVRHLALSERLAPLLQRILGQPVVLCNSLYFEKGSAQPPHVDSIYMTPRTPGHLVATWIALEDTHEAAGPLEYFPRSHLIEPFIFSSGSRHFVADEMKKWHEYIDAQVTKRGLQRQSFLAKKGDVFIWSSNLLHGGAPIRDDSLTRRSLVFHYYSLSDATALQSTLEPLSGNYWMARPPQPVSLEIVARVAQERRRRADQSLAAPPRDGYPDGCE